MAAGEPIPRGATVSNPVGVVVLGHLNPIDVHKAALIVDRLADILEDEPWEIPLPEVRHMAHTAERLLREAGALPERGR